MKREDLIADSHIFGRYFLDMLSNSLKLGVKGLNLCLHPGHHGRRACAGKRCLFIGVLPSIPGVQGCLFGCRQTWS